jgi:hypothetical protein
MHRYNYREMEYSTRGVRRMRYEFYVHVTASDRDRGAGRQCGRTIRRQQRVPNACSPPPPARLVVLDRGRQLVA